MRFTVVIPVYNAQSYLSECIESALAQTYRNFEIILVDDGSSDESGSICDRYASAYGRIAVYHTENKGQIHAREYAVSHAHGDYFVFLDADDRLRNNALETIAATIRKYQCDCVVFQYVRLHNGETFPVSHRETEQVLYNKRDIYRKCLMGQYNAIWMKAVKASVFDAEDTSPGDYQVRLGEDILQSLKIYKYSSSIAFIDAALYEYRDNPNGICYTISYDAYVKSMVVHGRVLEFLKKEDVFDAEDYAKYRQICIDRHVDEVLLICRLKTSVRNKVQLMKNIRDTDYFRNFVNRPIEKNHLSFKRRFLFALHRWKLDHATLLCTSVYCKLFG